MAERSGGCGAVNDYRQRRLDAASIRALDEWCRLLIATDGRETELSRRWYFEAWRVAHHIRGTGTFFDRLAERKNAPQP